MYVSIFHLLASVYKNNTISQFSTQLGRGYKVQG